MNILARKIKSLFILARLSATTNYYKLKFGKRLQIDGYIKVGKNFSLKMGKNSKLVVKGNLFMRNYCNISLEKGGHVYIGNGCFFNHFTSIVIHQQLTIGDEVICGEGVKIYDNDHKIADGRFYKNEFNRQPVNIGSHVWLANSVNVLKGTQIEDNVIVGAMALVRGKLDTGYIYGGIPAKKIKEI